MADCDELMFKPAEADVSINLGWFWHNNLYYLFKKNRTAKDLADIYFKTVGGNATLLLNVPPNKDGLIDKREQKTLRKFTSLINEPFKSEIQNVNFSVINEKLEERLLGESGCSFNDDDYILKATFSKEETVSTVVIREDLRFSQRVESFSVYAKIDGAYSEIGKGTVVGSKKILFLEKAVKTKELLFAVTGTRENPVISFGNATHEALSRLSEETFLQVFDGVERYEVSLEELNAGIPPLDLLAEKTNIFPSKGEARKMITANGFSINKEKFTDPQKAITADMLLNGKYLLCQKGKKNYYIVEAK